MSRCLYTVGARRAPSPPTAAVRVEPATAARRARAGRCSVVSNNFFLILERRLLRRGEFASTDELADRIIAFIKDYNRRAAPFRWTYDGRPLQVA